MPVSELNKLRRFALGAGLVLLSYSVAAIRLEDGKASLFGVPFLIGRPEFLPFGLILASVYGLLRYYYYGLMLPPGSPYRHRKDLLSKLQAKCRTGKYKGSVYFGPSRLCTTPTRQQEEIEKQTKEIIEAFPKLAGRRVSADVKQYDQRAYKFDESGKECLAYEAEISIPILCRIAAFLQDIDYTLPIWVNIFALVVTIPSFLKSIFSIFH